MDFKADHIDPGSQNIGGIQIGKFQSRLEQLRFAFVNDAFIFRGVQQIFQLLFRNGDGLGILLPEKAEETMTEP